MPRRNKPDLQVLICTLGAEGLERVASMNLPRVEGVGYLVSVQSSPLPLPQPLQRDDVEVCFTRSVGLSRNRNHALSCASAELALIADDDLEFSADGLQAVISTFHSNPEVDIALFRCNFPFTKSYPDKATDLPVKQKGYYITSYEIALRIAGIRACRLHFPENMGIGSERFHSGEEAVFIDHALEAGLICRFFPITIVSHPGIPTGMKKNPASGVLQADGVIIAMHYRCSILPRLILKAWRTGGNVFSNFYHLTRGAWYFLRHRSEFSRDYTN